MQWILLLFFLSPPAFALGQSGAGWDGAEGWRAPSGDSDRKAAGYEGRPPRAGSSSDYQARQKISLSEKAVGISPSPSPSISPSPSAKGDSARKNLTDSPLENPLQVPQTKEKPLRLNLQVGGGVSLWPSGVASALLEFEAPFFKFEKTSWLIQAGGAATLVTKGRWWKRNGVIGESEKFAVDPYISVHTGLRHNFDSRLIRASLTVGFVYKKLKYHPTIPTIVVSVGQQVSSVLVSAHIGISDPSYCLLSVTVPLIAL